MPSQVAQIELPELDLTPEDWLASAKEVGSMLRNNVDRAAIEFYKRHLRVALTQLSAIREESEELCVALRGVSSQNIDGPCFCDIPDTHVFLSHDPWRAKARASLDALPPQPASAGKEPNNV